MRFSCNLFSKTFRSWFSNACGSSHKGDLTLRRFRLLSLFRFPGLPIGSRCVEGCVGASSDWTLVRIVVSTPYCNLVLEVASGLVPDGTLLFNSSLCVTLPFLKTSVSAIVLSVRGRYFCCVLHCADAMQWIPFPRHRLNHFECVAIHSYFCCKGHPSWKKIQLSRRVVSLPVIYLIKKIYLLLCRPLTAQQTL